MSNSHAFNEQLQEVRAVYRFESKHTVLELACDGMVGKAPTFAVRGFARDGDKVADKPFMLLAGCSGAQVTLLAGELKRIADCSAMLMNHYPFEVAPTPAAAPEKPVTPPAPIVGGPPGAVAP